MAATSCKICSGCGASIRKSSTFKTCPRCRYRAAKRRRENRA